MIRRYDYHKFTFIAIECFDSMIKVIFVKEKIHKTKKENDEIQVIVEFDENGKTLDELMDEILVSLAKSKF